MNEALSIRFAARQIQGGRSYQEDDYGVYEESVAVVGRTEAQTILVLSDGMGGHIGGSVASGLCVNTFIQGLDQLTGPMSVRLLEGLHLANDALNEKITQSPELEGMGATLVAAAVTERGLEWISVGDSPLWLFRQGHLQRLNADHSMKPVLENLVEKGSMTPQEAKTDKMRNSLRSVVAGQDINLIDQSSRAVGLKSGDRILLSSDGLETLSEPEIERLLSSLTDAPVKTVVDVLIDRISDINKPSQDNTTVLILDVDRNLGRGAPPPTHASVKNRHTDQAKTKKRFNIVTLAMAATILSMLLIIVFLIFDRSSLTDDNSKSTQEEPEVNPKTAPKTTKDPLKDIPTLAPEEKNPQSKIEAEPQTETATETETNIDPDEPMPKDVDADTQNNSGIAQDLEANRETPSDVTPTDPVTIPKPSVSENQATKNSGKNKEAVIQDPKTEPDGTTKNEVPQPKLAPHVTRKEEPSTLPNESD